MSTTITPYVFFGGRCEEALEFYRKALGAEVTMLMRYTDSPDAPPPGLLAEGFESKVMHAEVRVRGVPLMMSDGCGPQTSFEGFKLSLALPTEADAAAAFAALSEGGSVEMPLTKTFWSPCFGMLVDRIGVSWMVTVTGQAPTAAAVAAASAN